MASQTGFSPPKTPGFPWISWKSFEYKDLTNIENVSKMTGMPGMKVDARFLFWRFFSITLLHRRRPVKNHVNDTGDFFRNIHPPQ